jgi:hypothetical protein
MSQARFDIARLLGAVDRFNVDLIETIRKESNPLTVHYPDKSKLQFVRLAVDCHPYLSSSIDEDQLRVTFHLDEQPPNEEPVSPIIVDHPLRPGLPLQQELPIETKARKTEGDYSETLFPTEWDDQDSLPDDLPVTDLEQKKREAEERKRKVEQQRKENREATQKAAPVARKKSEVLRKIEPDPVKYPNINNDFPLEDMEWFENKHEEEIIERIEDIDKWPLFVDKIDNGKYSYRDFTRNELIDIAVSLGIIYGRIAYCLIHAHGRDLEKDRYVGRVHLKLMASINPYYHEVKDLRTMNPDLLSKMFLEYYEDHFSPNTRLARITNGFLPFENEEHHKAYGKLHGYLDKPNLRVLLRDWIVENELGGYFENNHRNIQGHGVHYECEQTKPLPNSVNMCLVEYAKYVKDLPHMTRCLKSKAPSKYEYAYFLSHFIPMEKIDRVIKDPSKVKPSVNRNRAKLKKAQVSE